jgi:hypothetical protein
MLSEALDLIKQLTVEFALEDVTSFASASKLFIAYIVTLETDLLFFQIRSYYF